VNHSLWQQLTDPFKALAGKPTRAIDRPRETEALLSSPLSSACLATLDSWRHERRVLSVESGLWQGQSLLLAIDVKRELLWLDDVFPVQQHLSQGQHLQVSLRQGFEHCHFSSVVIAIIDKPHGRMIALQIPSQIHRSPRRKQRRFILPGPALNVRVRASGLHATSAELINISAGGMRLAINGNLLKSYRPNSSLPFCRFALSPNLLITCSGVIKAASLDKKVGRKTQVSIAFADITQTQRQQIDAYLHKLEALGSCPQVPMSA